jgi:hypothetical protein
MRLAAFVFIAISLYEVPAPAGDIDWQSQEQKRSDDDRFGGALLSISLKSSFARTER